MVAMYNIKYINTVDQDEIEFVF